MRRGVMVLAGILFALCVLTLPAGATPLGVNGQIAWDTSGGLDRS